MEQRNGGFVNGRYAHIWFNGEVAADNGLTYGANIYFGTGHAGWASTAGFPGRQYVYLKGGWGEIQAGNWIGADSGLNANPLPGGILKQRGSPGGALDTPHGWYVKVPAGGLATSHINPNFFDQSPKVTFITPAVNGFTAGLSYTPDSKHRSSYATLRSPMTLPPAPRAGNWTDVFGMGVKWTGEMGSTTVTASVVGGTSDDGTDASGATTRQGLGFYEATGRVDFGGITFAGTFWDFGSGEAPAGVAQDWTGWGLDAAYSFGPFGVEVGYGHAERTRVGGGMNDSSEMDGLALSLGYEVAPGLNWYGDVTQITRDVAGFVFSDTSSYAGRPSDGKYEATAFITGLTVNF